MESTIEDLESKLERLQSIEKDYNKITQLDKFIQVDTEDLEDFDKNQLKILINLITNIQKQVIEESLTIRVVEGISHRDGAVRSLGLLKANLQKLIKSTKVTKK